MCRYCYERLEVCQVAYKALLNLGKDMQAGNHFETVTISKQQYEDMRKKCKQHDNQHYLRRSKTAF